MHPMILMTQGTRSAFVMLKMGDSCHLHNVNLKESYKLHLQVNYWTGNQQNPLSLSLSLYFCIYESFLSPLNSSLSLSLAFFLLPPIFVFMSLFSSFFLSLFLSLWQNIA